MFQSNAILGLDSPEKNKIISKLQITVDEKYAWKWYGTFEIYNSAKVWEHTRVGNTYYGQGYWRH